MALAVTGLAGSGLLSYLYSDFAFKIERIAPGSEAAVAATTYARQLAPWDARARARSSEALASTHHAEDAREQAAAAIRLAPADGYRWAQYARLLGQQGQFDENLVAIYRMAIDLHPNAGPLRLLIALEGVQRWRFGDDTLRAIWLENARKAMYFHPVAFLRYVSRLRRERAFCAYASPQMPSVRRWCANAPAVRAGCDKPGLTPDQKVWCHRAGFVPPRAR